MTKTGMLGTKKSPGTKSPGMPFFIPFAKLSVREEPTSQAMGRSSGFRFLLIAVLPILTDSGSTAFVPGHSGGSATDLHRFPLDPYRGQSMTAFIRLTNQRSVVN